MDIYLNGSMIAPDQARVHLEDAGFQHAVGLFETLSVYHGRPFRLEQHLARLAGSAQQLGLTRELHTEPLADAVYTCIRHNELDLARLRLTLTAGNLSLLRDQPETPPAPTVAVVPSAPTRYDPAYFAKGVTAVMAPPGANPFDALAGHKTLSYWGRLRTLRQAAAVGAGEAIWLNVTNHLASGAVSNLFLVKDGRLLTPFARGEEAPGALPAPVLPGVTRAAVLGLAEARSVPTEKRMLTVNDLLEADEVFLTNSSWLVLPVTRIEKSTVGDGVVGPVTSDLRMDLVRLITRETGGDPDSPQA